MVYVDTTQPDRELRPGVDLWRVIACEEKTSRSGDAMLNLKLAREEDQGDHVYDVVMLEGKGRGIGIQKLRAFLPDGFKGELDPVSLIGARVWADMSIEEYQGKQSLKVDIGGLKHAGYQRADDPPDGRDAPPKDEDYSEIPF